MGVVVEWGRTVEWATGALFRGPAPVVALDATQFFFNWIRSFLYMYLRALSKRFISLLLG